jgi:hypothetical protein
MAAQTQTIISGVDGDLSFVAIGGGQIPNGKFQSYTFGVGQVINNISGFDGAGWQEFIGGIKGADWSAVMSHRYNGTPNCPFGLGSAITASEREMLPMSGATATFTVAAGCTIAIAAIIQRHGIVQDVNGASVSALSGPCSGPPTIIWDEA